MTHCSIARQGHKYQFGDKQVIAMESGVVVQVRPLDHTEPYPLGSAMTVKASWLQPLPMKYFHGETPK